MIILIRITLKSVGLGFVTIYPYFIIFWQKSNSDWNLESAHNFWRKAFRKEWNLVIDFAVELRFLSSCFLLCYQMTLAFLHTMPGKPRWLAQWSLVLFKPVFGNLFVSYEWLVTWFTWHGMRGLSHEHEGYIDLTLHSEKSEITADW